MNSHTGPGALPLPEPTYASTPTVGYWQSKLAAALGAAKPHEVEMAGQEWTARAGELRTVQEALVAAIPLVQSGMNADSGVETMRAMFAASKRAERRAETMDRAAAALSRVRVAIEEAGKVLSPLQGTEVYEPVKGAPPVNGWDSPRGLKIAARFAEEQKQFQSKVLEREEAARLALIELDQQYQSAGLVFEEAHQTGAKPPQQGTQPIPIESGVVVPPVFRGTVPRDPSRPPLPDVGAPGVDVDVPPVPPVPPVPGPLDPITDPELVPRAPATPPWVNGGECAPINARELQGSMMKADDVLEIGTYSHEPGFGGVPRPSVGGGPIPGGMLSAGGFIGAGALLGALGSLAPAKPAPPQPLADDPATTSKPGTSSNSNANQTGATGRGMGGMMGGGAGAGGAAGAAGGRGRSRRAFANAVKVTQERKGRDRRNAFEREEDRDDWI